MGAFQQIVKNFLKQTNYYFTSSLTAVITHSTTSVRHTKEDYNRTEQIKLTRHCSSFLVTSVTVLIVLRFNHDDVKYGIIIFFLLKRVMHVTSSSLCTNTSNGFSRWLDFFSLRDTVSKQKAGVCLRVANSTKY